MSKSKIEAPVGQSVASNSADDTFNKLLQEPSADKSELAPKQEQQQEQQQEQKNGLHTGYIDQIDEQGYPIIVIDGQGPATFKAQFLCPPEQLIPNAQCAVMYQEGLQNMPVIMGVFQNPIISLSGEGIEQNLSSETPSGEIQGAENETHKTIKANQSLQITCGKASIALSQDGRVEIRGTTLVQHSTGLNRIRGASVKIN